MIPENEKSKDVIARLLEDPLALQIPPALSAIKGSLGELAGPNEAEVDSIKEKLFRRLLMQYPKDDRPVYKSAVISSVDSVVEALWANPDAVDLVRDSLGAAFAGAKKIKAVNKMVKAAGCEQSHVKMATRVSPAFANIGEDIALKVVTDSSMPDGSDGSWLVTGCELRTSRLSRAGDTGVLLVRELDSTGDSTLFTGTRTRKSGKLVEVGQWLQFTTSDGPIRVGRGLIGVRDHERRFTGISRHCAERWVPTFHAEISGPKKSMGFRVPDSEMCC